MHERDTPKKNLPFGRWPSTICAERVANGTPRIAEPSIVGDRVFWLQGLPQEKGRTTIMSQPIDGSAEPASLLPSPLNARSKVHEYGGGSYLITETDIFFVQADDQQIYRIQREPSNKTIPLAITDTPSARYADLILDPAANAIIAVCESHNAESAHPSNSLVSIDLNNGNVISIIAEGADFYASPTVSSDGQYLAWLSWNAPDMPWDTTELAVTRRSANDAFCQTFATTVQGHSVHSLFLPRFHSNGDLYFVSDVNQWWNIYVVPHAQLRKNTAISHAVTQMEAEFATPQWVFRMSTYDFLDNNTLLACASTNGEWQLMTVDISNNQWPAPCKPVANAPSSINDLFADGKGTAGFIGAAPAQAPTLYLLDDNNFPLAVTTGDSRAEESEISLPVAVEFPTSQNANAYGFYYAPRNSQYKNDDALPPLIVICHGGPTAATDTAFNAKIQYWTNRGFAVMDVNYRGSTGYGRDYRHALSGQWGVFDVDDVCAAAEYAVAQGWVDKNKLIIKGSSAGGYTVLAALAFRDTFSAGVSLYGIGDLETLAQDTHKFEAQYLEKLVGSYQHQPELYQQRSPIHAVDKISCPLLVFQGLEDKVVPPNQAEAMVDAVKSKGLYVEYVTFADEGHGFRNATNIKTMLETELAFYQKVFEL
ncbi:alpha/beta hydrolase family protein [Teredinibacter turnerae]|uniref:S9 family peptidase n=1 Tax=Teredinibacter turnerae TaxID=2426 RepID=UPI00037A43D9|nr:S9 family peptidase [Teredinibacter turnerae]